MAAARALDRPGSAAKPGYMIGRGAWVLLAPVNTVAIMHFWYDGFVWSVRKHQVVQT